MSSLRFRYQTIEFGDTDIHLRTLRNNQEFSDDHDVALKLGISSATWPLFGILWPSGNVLAHLMQHQAIAGKHIPEISCGIALSSLVLNQRHADITATDHHPEAGNFQSANVLLNRGRDIPFIRTGWGDAGCGLGEFDLIIGSDLLHERDHAELLAGFIQQHATESCEVIIVDPGRGHAAHFNRIMQGLGYAHSQSRPTQEECLLRPFPRGYIHHYTRGHQEPVNEYKLGLPANNPTHHF